MTLEVKDGPDHFAETRVNRKEVDVLRAEIRNGIRGFLERVPALARLFGRPYLRELSPRDISGEEEAIRNFRRRKMSRSRTTGGAVLGHADPDAGRTGLAEEVLEEEEYIKYNAARLAYLLERGDYWRAGELAAAEREKYANGSNRDYFCDVFQLRVLERVRDLYKKSGRENFGDHFLRLHSVCAFGGGELADFVPELAGGSEVGAERVAGAEAFDKVRELALKTHPALFVAVDDWLYELGIPAGGEADFTREIVKKRLIRSLRQHLSVYVWDREIYRSFGFTNASPEDDPVIGRMVVEKFLAKMRQEPKLYFFMKERWKQSGIINGEELDNDPEIRKALSEHLYKWSLISKPVYAKLRYRWSLQGVSECELDENERKSVRSRYETEIGMGSLWCRLRAGGSIHEAGELMEELLAAYEKTAGNMILVEQKKEIRQTHRMFEVGRNLKKFMADYPQFEEICLQLYDELKLPQHNTYDDD